MSKTDKELAVEITKAYIEASSKLTLPNGGSKSLVKADSAIAIMEASYNALKKLD